MLETLGYSKNHNDRQINDFYATPIEEVINILNFENIVGNVFDPCVGTGNILTGVNLFNPNISTFGSDIIDYLGGLYPISNFLDDNIQFPNIDNIITNPPFKLMNEFIKKSLSLANNKVIILGRLQLLETIDRYEEIFKYNNPSRVYVYINRISCLKDNNDNNKNCNSMAYAWYVWDKNCNNQNTEIRWIYSWNKYIPFLNFI